MNAPLRLAPSSAVSGSLLAFADVRKTYVGRDGRERVALDGVTFEMADGEILAVIGAASSGKSALARLAAGLELPNSGAVALGGADLYGNAARQGVIYLNATAEPPSGRPIGEIVAEFGNPALPGARRRLDAIVELLELGPDMDRYADELSNGARRRVALARALAAEPRLLVLDGATSALDPEIAEAVLAAIHWANREIGVGILLVTHDMSAVTALATRVVVLDAGRAVEEGPTARVFARSEHAVTRRFAAAATGATLPPFLAGKLSHTPSPMGRALVRLAFEGQAATKPVLTSVARELGFDVGIVAGSLGAAGGAPYGVLIVAAPSDEPYFTAVVERFEDSGVGVELLGFVA